MSLQIVYGKAGTGKSTYCLQQIKDNINSDVKSYVITPEQFSYSAEKNLLKELETQSVINAEVISFNRMANRLRTEVGGLTKNLLSKTGKAMLVYTILKKHKKDLKFLGQSDENLELALSEITEFKKHNIMAKNLNTIIEKVNDKKLKYKLADFEKIYSEYDNWIKDKFIDEEDVLTKLKYNLEKSKIFNGTNIYIDEFSGFTSQEYDIIGKLLEKANKVVITICTNSLEMNKLPEEDIFYENKKMAQRLLEYAKDNEIKIEEPIKLITTYRFKNEELQHIEENLFSYNIKKYIDKPKNVDIFLTTNSYTELEHIATQITKLVKNNNYKYNDIAVVCNNMNEITGMVKAVFNRFNIPVFIDQKNELTQNILIKYLLSILEIFAKNWSKESVFNYLKLGFSNTSINDIYLLENYCNKWEIQGKKWFLEDYWINNADMKNVKNSFIEPLLKLKKNLDTEKTCKEYTINLYKFLEEQNIKSMVQKKVDLFEQNSELVLANEYARSFQILINVFDEIVMLFENEKINFAKYSDLLKTAFKYEELGQIPQAIDQVIFGDINRSKSHAIKVMFNMSLNDRNYSKSKQR